MSRQNVVAVAIRPREPYESLRYFKVAATMLDHRLRRSLSVAGLLGCSILLPQIASAQTKMSEPDDGTARIQLPNLPLLRLGESQAGGQIASVPSDPFMTAEQELGILAVLQSHDATSWEDVGYADLGKLLSKHLTVWIDRLELDLLGINPETIIAGRRDIPPGPIGARLHLFLDRDELTFNIQANQLNITSNDVVPPTRIYEITPIVLRSRAGTRLFDFRTLIALIEQSLDPDSWLNAGGTNQISHFISGARGNEKGILVVTCPTPVHLQLQTLLNHLNIGPSKQVGRGTRAELSVRPQRNQPVFDDRMQGGFF